MTGPVDYEDEDVQPYYVTWSCRIEATSPMDAAIIARDMLLDHTNEQSVFYVEEESGRQFYIDALLKVDITVPPEESRAEA